MRGRALQQCWLRRWRGRTDKDVVADDAALKHGPVPCVRHNSVSRMSSGENIKRKTPKRKTNGNSQDAHPPREMAPPATGHNKEKKMCGRARTDCDVVADSGTVDRGVVLRRGVREPAR